MTSQVALVVKNPPANAGDSRNMGSIPGSGRSPGVGNGNPLQYSCLENFMDRGAWQATFPGAAESWTWLSTEHSRWCVCVCVCVCKLLQSCPILCDPTDRRPPGSSMGFSRQEYWSGLPGPSPGDLPHLGIKATSHVSCLGRWILYRQHRGWQF